MTTTLSDASIMTNRHVPQSKYDFSNSNMADGVLSWEKETEVTYRGDGLTTQGRQGKNREESVILKTFKGNPCMTKPGRRIAHVKIITDIYYHEILFMIFQRKTYQSPWMPST